MFLPTPAGKTKVVATNIAETSVTIDGIAAVIDSGIAKINYYNQRDFTSSLVSLPLPFLVRATLRPGRTHPTEYILSLVQPRRLCLATIVRRNSRRP